MQPQGFISKQKNGEKINVNTELKSHLVLSRNQNTNESDNKS